ncbi:MAG: hypothetical protein MR742_00685 [Clostridiales bacterium]|nr:hypothetical protein [Clostridiales bacterium]
MPQTPAQKQAASRYRAKNGRAQVNIELTSEDRLHWQAYAQARGLSLTAMARQCVARCMAQDAFLQEADKKAAPTMASHATEASRSDMRQLRSDRGIEGMEGMD